MNLVSLGFLLIILGMLFIAIGILTLPAAERHVEGAAVVFIGPFPLVFASSERMAFVSLVITLAILLAVILWRWI